jgi:hypothetical protein
LTGERAPATRRKRLSEGEDNENEDHWVANFISRLTGRLRNMASPRRKQT